MKLIEVFTGFKWYLNAFNEHCCPWVPVLSLDVPLGGYIFSATKIACIVTYWKYKQKGIQKSGPKYCTLVIQILVRYRIDDEREFTDGRAAIKWTTTWIWLITDFFYIFECKAIDLQTCWSDANHHCLGDPNTKACSWEFGGFKTGQGTGIPARYIAVEVWTFPRG